MSAKTKGLVDWLDASYPHFSEEGEKVTITKAEDLAGGSYDAIVNQAKAAGLKMSIVVEPIV